MGRAAIVCLVGLTACFGASNTTESGLGLPTVSVEIPSEVAPGSVHDVVLHVTNPGPGDISSLTVGFALVGPVQEDGSLATPIVGPGMDGRNPAVLSETPEATAVSENGSVFVFGPIDGQPRLPEGEEIEIVLEIKMPEEEGLAANSVQVSDGNEVDRGTGVRLETTIRG